MGAIALIGESMIRRREPKCDTEQQLKDAALRLFGDHGIDGVTLREISTAASQKNHGAVFYYFRTKEELVYALLKEGVGIINDRQNRWLDELEAGAGEIEIRDIARILIFSHVDVHGGGGEDTFSRFFQQAITTHREWVRAANADELNADSGYSRCLDHLRRLMPEMSDELETQRFIFLGVTLRGVMAAREAALSDQSREHPTWNSELMLAHFVESLTALLASKPPTIGMEPIEQPSRRGQTLASRLPKWTRINRAGRTS